MMIYKSHEKAHIWIKKEDYEGRPHAYEAACINAEIENECSSGEWYDSETGQHLFTEVCTFVPDSGYYDNGQGSFVYEYTAHFPLKEGQTAEQAFKELRGDSCKQWQAQQEADKRAEAIQKLPVDIQERLKRDLIYVKLRAEEELQLKIKQVQEAAIEEGRQRIIAKKEAIKTAYEQRKNDPVWQTICQAARTFVASNQKEQAKILVQDYLSKQRSR